MQRHLSLVLLASLILVLSGCEEKPMQESVQEPVVEQLDDKADKADKTTQSVGDQNTEEEHAINREETEQQESIDTAEINLDDVFTKFEGQWIFDQERGACVGVERTETCPYGVDGTKWTVWVTGGDILSDADVYGYTDDSILFRVEHAGYSSFYELTFNMDDALVFAYGTSLDAMDDIIVCE